MATMLICDDEEKIREIIKKYAIFSNHEVIEAKDGFDALQKINSNEIDIIIMDVMMPQLDGFSTVKEIRKSYATPVIMLSAKGEEYDRIHGFELGVDDYVVKPFSGKELMMRVDVILKRMSSNDEANQSHEVIQIDTMKVDFTGRIVSIDHKIVNMTPREYDLFFYFVRNRNIALTREKLITEVWGFDFYGDNRTLDTHIKLLRKSLGRYSKLIVTLRGVGYRFET